MLQNYSKWAALILPAWVFFSFIVSQSILVGLIYLLDVFNVPINSLNESVRSTLFASLMYVIMLGLVVGLPLAIKKMKINKTEIGLDKLPTWTDIFLAPAGLIVYYIMASILMLIITWILSYFPGVDIRQAQDVGFDQLYRQFEYILAFITLVVLAPVAEEVIFRGFLFGKLKKYIPIWAAILITSLLFGAIHGQWDLAIDTFSLSVILCLLRLSTGNIWASILVHMAKNGIAYYFLFINPMFLTTLKG